MTRTMLCKLVKLHRIELFVYNLHTVYTVNYLINVSSVHSKLEHRPRLLLDKPAIIFESNQIFTFIIRQFAHFGKSDN